MTKIPLEDQPKLAEKYGIAFAWFNLAEESLKWAMLTKSKLTSNVPKIITELFDNQMFGQKIRLSEGMFDSSLAKKLWQLNNIRLLLAHGITGETANIGPDKKPIFTGEITITHKGKDTQLNEEFLDSAIALAKEVSDQLFAIR